MLKKIFDEFATKTVVLWNIEKSKWRDIRHDWDLLDN
jgi:hypothetical protein